MTTAKGIHVVGKRKTAIARLWLKPGTGVVTINKRTMDDYYSRAASKLLLLQPFSVTNTAGKYDVDVNVCGGGLQGQAGAIRHAIARALSLTEPELRKALKSAGMLTRDSRRKERKLYGQPGARKRFQFSKR